jgi:hypothetical protein
MRFIDDAIDRNPSRKFTAARRKTMTRLSTSVGALALAAIAFAFPADAMPKGGNQQACIDRCYINPGRNGSVEQCTAICRATVGNARAAAARRGPVLHGGYTNPTGPTLPTTIVHKH